MKTSVKCSASAKEGNILLERGKKEILGKRRESALCCAIMPWSSYMRPTKNKEHISDEEK